MFTVKFATQMFSLKMLKITSRSMSLRTFYIQHPLISYQVGRAQVCLLCNSVVEETFKEHLDRTDFHKDSLCRMTTLQDFHKKWLEQDEKFHKFRHWTLPKKKKLCCLFCKRNYSINNMIKHLQDLPCCFLPDDHILLTDEIAWKDEKEKFIADHLRFQMTYLDEVSQAFYPRQITDYLLNLQDFPIYTIQRQLDKTKCLICNELLIDTFLHEDILRHVESEKHETNIRNKENLLLLESYHKFWMVQEPQIQIKQFNFMTSVDTGPDFQTCLACNKPVKIKDIGKHLAIDCTKETNPAKPLVSQQVVTDGNSSTSLAEADKKLKVVGVAKVGSPVAGASKDSSPKVVNDVKVKDLVYGLDGLNVLETENLQEKIPTLVKLWKKAHLCVCCGLYISGTGNEHLQSKKHKQNMLLPPNYKNYETIQKSLKIVNATPNFKEQFSFRTLDSVLCTKCSSTMLFKNVHKHLNKCTGKPHITTTVIKPIGTSDSSSTPPSTSKPSPLSLSKSAGNSKIKNTTHYFNTQFLEATTKPTNSFTSLNLVNSLNSLQETKSPETLNLSPSNNDTKPLDDLNFPETSKCSASSSSSSTNLAAPNKMYSQVVLADLYPSNVSKNAVPLHSLFIQKRSRIEIFCLYCSIPIGGSETVHTAGRKHQNNFQNKEKQLVLTCYHLHWLDQAEQRQYDQMKFNPFSVESMVCKSCREIIVFKELQHHFCKDLTYKDLVNGLDGLNVLETENLQEKIPTFVKLWKKAHLCVCCGLYISGTGNEHLQSKKHTQNMLLPPNYKNYETIQKSLKIVNATPNFKEQFSFRTLDSVLCTKCSSTMLFKNVHKHLNKCTGKPHITTTVIKPIGTSDSSSTPPSTSKPSPLSLSKSAGNSKIKNTTHYFNTQFLEATTKPTNSFTSLNLVNSLNSLQETKSPETPNLSPSNNDTKPLDDLNFPETSKCSASSSSSSTNLAAPNKMYSQAVLADLYPSNVSKNAVPLHSLFIQKRSSIEIFCLYCSIPIGGSETVHTAGRKHQNNFQNKEKQLVLTCYHLHWLDQAEQRQYDQMKFNPFSVESMVCKSCREIIVFKELQHHCCKDLTYKAPDYSKVEVRYCQLVQEEFYSKSMMDVISNILKTKLPVCRHWQGRIICLLCGKKIPRNLTVLSNHLIIRHSSNDPELWNRLAALVKYHKFWELQTSEDQFLQVHFLLNYVWRNSVECTNKHIVPYENILDHFKICYFKDSDKLMELIKKIPKAESIETLSCISSQSDVGQPDFCNIPQGSSLAFGSLLSPPENEDEAEDKDNKGKENVMEDMGVDQSDFCNVPHGSSLASRSLLSPPESEDEAEDKDNKGKENVMEDMGVDQPDFCNVPHGSSLGSGSLLSPPENEDKAEDTDNKGKDNVGENSEKKHNIVPSVKFPNSQNLLNLLPKRMILHIKYLTVHQDHVACSICKTEITKSPKDLIKHIDSVYHKGKTRSKSPAYSYQCDICSFNCETENDWQQHLDSTLHTEIFADIGVARKAMINEFECFPCRLVMYGDELTILRHEGKLNDDRNCNKTEDINLLSSVKKIFQTEMNCNRELKRLMEVMAKDNSAMEKCVQAVETSLRKIYPVRSHPGYLFISRVRHELGTKFSDLDLFVDICLTGTSKKLKQEIFQKMKEVFLADSKNFKNVQSIDSARTPIIKLVHIFSGIGCDVLFDSGLRIQSTQYINFCLDLQPAARPALILLKTWINRLNIKSITSYCVCMLFILQLQLHGLAISVHKLRKLTTQDVDTIDDWPTITYNKPMEVLKTHVASYNKGPFYLIREFFRMYSTFNFSSVVCCPLLGTTILVSNFLGVEKYCGLPDEMNHYIRLLNFLENKFQATGDMFVQDPFDLSHNLTESVTKADVKQFKEFCKITYDIMKS